MTDDDIDLTRVPLLYAEGCTLKTAAYWHRGNVTGPVLLEAGTEVTAATVAQYRDIAPYVACSLRVAGAAAAVKARVRANREACRQKRRKAKMRDISRQYDPESIVFRQGDNESLECFFLAEGAVDVEIDGLRIATIDKPGQPIGELSFLTGEPRSATVKVIKPSTLLCIPHRDLGEFLEKFPTIAITLFESMAERLKATSLNLKTVQAQLSRSADGQVVGSDHDALQRLTVYASQQVGVQRGNLKILEALIAHLEAEYADKLAIGRVGEIFGYVREYRDYLQRMNKQAQAMPLIEHDLLPERLRALVTKKQ